MKQSLQLQERNLGPDHPHTMSSINNLAALYYAQGRYSEAEVLYKRSLQLKEQVLGQEHPSALATQKNYIYLLISDKRYVQALRRLKLLESHLLSRSFQELYTSSSEKVRRLYLRSTSNFQNIALSLAKQQPGKEYRQYAAEVMLRWKQVYAEESSTQHRLLNLSNDSEAAELRTQLAAAQAKASQALRQPKQQQNIHKLIEQFHQDETALLALARHLRTGLEVGKVTLDRVLSSLPAETGLIEYRLFRLLDFKTDKPGEQHLAALLLLADPKANPRFIFQDLGPFAEIERHLKDADAQAYNRLLAPFDDQIKNLKQLYIAPDGPLNLISFASLRLPDGRFLAERQQINRLQTGRDLLEDSSKVSPGKGLVTIGGVNYGPVPPKSKTEQTGPLPMTAFLERTARELEDGFAYLPGSRREAKHISSKYKTASQDLLLIGEQAGEHRLKQLDHPPKILHLSTHGFYLADNQENTLADEAPLLLSGLALAGANNGLQGRLDAHGNDGLLYALEVLGLNLQGTDLVSLSACNTGKGVMDYSEGVYGLVRAFRTAGAKNVLMTLTPVGDKPAQEFMETFYDHYLADNLPPSEALHRTRLDFIGHANSAYRDPAVWSPYVMVGK